jgi:hypothetical protein
MLGTTFRAAWKKSCLLFFFWTLAKNARLYQGRWRVKQQAGSIVTANESNRQLQRETEEYPEHGIGEWADRRRYPEYPAWSAWDHPTNKRNCKNGLFHGYLLCRSDTKVGTRRLRKLRIMSIDQTRHSRIWLAGGNYTVYWELVTLLMWMMQLM